jgi:hypothetical protein
MSSQREKFADPGFGDNNAGILGANRSMGWSPIPLDAPQWVKDRVAETRNSILANRETRSSFTWRDGMPAVVRSVKKIVKRLSTPKPQRTFADTIAEAREICRKNGITHWLDGDVEVADDAAVIARRKSLLNAIIS